MNDLVYKLAVLNILNEGAELLRHALENVDIVGVARVKYEWGLGLIESCIADVKELSPVQPESCERCKHLTDSDRFWICPKCKRQYADKYEKDGENNE